MHAKKREREKRNEKKNEKVPKKRGSKKLSIQPPSCPRLLSLNPKTNPDTCVPTRPFTSPEKINTNNSEPHKDTPTPPSFRYRRHLQLLHHRRQRRRIHIRRRKQCLRISSHAQPTIPIVRMLVHNRIIPINDFLLRIFEILVDVRRELLRRG